MWQLLQIELFKIFRKPRTYISFGAIAAMVIIIQIALKFDGESYIEFITGSLKDSLDIPFANILNGYFVCFIILNLLLIHISIRFCRRLKKRAWTNWHSRFNALILKMIF